MSGRPIFITVATATTTYPVLGKAWDSTPTRVVPAAEFITPDTLEPAEYMNYRLGNITDDLSWLSTLQVRNLGTYGGSYNGTPENYAKPVFDAVAGWWLAGGPTGGTGFQFSKDYGRTWALAAAAVDTTPRVHAIYADSAGAWYTVGTGAIGPARYSKSTNQGVAWTTGNIDATWTPVKKVHDLLLFLGTTFIVIGDNGTNTKIYTTNTTFTTWTHITNPASINTVVTDWHAAMSTTRWMAVAGSVGGFYCTSTDGVNFTAAAMSGVAAAWIPKGICFSNGFFYAVGDDATDTKVYSSSNGTAWTLVATLTGLVCNDIAANGTSMVIVQNVTGQNPKTYFSIDAGVTWKATPVQLSSDGTPFMPVRVLASDYQLGVANGTSINLSPALGQ